MCESKGPKGVVKRLVVCFDFGSCDIVNIFSYYFRVSLMLESWLSLKTFLLCVRHNVMKGLICIALLLVFNFLISCSNGVNIFLFNTRTLVFQEIFLTILQYVSLIFHSFLFRIYNIKLLSNFNSENQ